MVKNCPVHSGVVVVVSFFLLHLPSFNLLAQDANFAVLDFEDDSTKTNYRVELITVDREKGQYLGHPTTCLLEDGSTMLCVYPKGHGKGPIVHKRSTDGGKNWSDRLPTPDSWTTSKETPTLHRVTGPDGKKRIIMFSGLHPIRMAVSEDKGENWTGLQKIGEFGGIVAMSSVIKLTSGPGHYMALFHDDGRFISSDSKRKEPVVFTVFKTSSIDGGLNWSNPTVVVKSSEKHLCEPGVIRSPDKKRLACLLRENSRRHPSQIIFSDDEGNSWSEARDLPKWLWGDRHTAKYLSDGRIFISFRCVWPKQFDAHEYQGDWVGWIGTFEDLVAAREGEVFIRLQDNTKSADCAYPGVEVLPDGTVVTTTYGHWVKNESPYIIAIRFRLNEEAK